MLRASLQVVFFLVSGQVWENKMIFNSVYNFDTVEH